MKEFVEGAFGEEERNEKRRKLKTRAGLASLVLALLCIGIYAGRLQRRLEAAALVKQSINLAEQAMKTLSGDPWSAYLLAERAFQISPTFESEKALVNIYPFLYPIKKRYRGNGFIHMPASRALLILDHANDSVTAYDDHGSAIWQFRVPGLLSVGGVEVSDSSHMVLLRGTGAILIDMSGRILFRSETDAKYFRSDFGRRRFCFSTGTVLVRYHPDSGLDSIRLDTLNEHQALIREHKWIDGFEWDMNFENLIVQVDSQLTVFDLRSSSLKRLHKWKFPEEVISSMHGPNPGEYVALTQKRLFHLKWSRTTPIHIVQELDYRGDGVTPNHPSHGHSGRTISSCYVFEGGQTCIYDPRARKLRYVAIDPEKAIYGVDLVHDRILSGPNWWNTVNDTMLYASIAGDWLRSVSCLGCDRDDIRIVRDGRLSREERHFDKKAMLTTLWSPEFDTIRQQWIPLSYLADPERSFSHAISDQTQSDETIKALEGAIHRTHWDSSTNVQRILLPPSDVPKHDYAMPGKDSLLNVVYSDSLIVTLTPHHTNGVSRRANAAGRRGRAWIECAFDSTLSTYTLDRDQLVFWKDRVDSEMDSACIAIPPAIQDSIARLSEESDSEAQAKLLNRYFAVIYTPICFSLNCNDVPCGFLVDLRTNQVVDTGLFALPAQYYSLPLDAGLIRIQQGMVSWLDSSLRRTHVINTVPMDADNVVLSGNRLLFLDSLRTGVVGILDPLTRNMNRVAYMNSVPYVNAFSKSMDNTSLAAYDNQGVLYILLDEHKGFNVGSMETRFTKAFAFDGTDLLDSFSLPGHGFNIERRLDGIVHFIAAPTSPRIVQGGMTRVHGSATHYQYDRDSRSFSIPLPPDEPTYDKVHRAIERQGKPFFGISGTPCGGYLYSSFRAVDHIERFPLYGADVIKEVREEKQFGKFWTHINAEPLINKVLGTDAYNTGYSIGSLLRSTWVRLGLLLGAGALAYAWWSRRRRLRAV